MLEHATIHCTESDACHCESTADRAPLFCLFRMGDTCDSSKINLMPASRVVVAGVAARGGLRWWRGTRVVVVRCVLLAETAVGR